MPPPNRGDGISVSHLLVTCVCLFMTLVAAQNLLGLVNNSGSETFDAFRSRGAQMSLLLFLVMKLFVKLFYVSIPVDH